MDKEPYEKINDEDENPKLCLNNPNRKQKIILLVIFIISGIVAISSLIICFFIFLKNDAKVVTIKEINLTLIGDVFPDGEKITAIGLTITVEDNEDPNFTIDNTKLTSHCFSVQERNISSIHSCSSLDNPHSIENGPYIIIELNKDDPNAFTYSQSNIFQNTTFHIQQRADIDLINGNYLQKTSKIYSNDPYSNSMINLIVDDFETDTFYSPDNSNHSLSYNIFIPKSLHRSKPPQIDHKYPLILFLHDFSVECTDPRMTLTQGIGGTIWATPIEQSKHESFVVAPCFTGKIVNETFHHNGQFDLIMPLLNYLINTKFHGIVDVERVYTTGQSMGSMASISLMCENPGFFASGLFVAGKWDPNEMKKLANQSFWILCSEGDESVKKNKDEEVKNLVSLGVKVRKESWFGNASVEERRENVERILDGGDDDGDFNKFYVSFVNNTVVPKNIPYNVRYEHTYTWKVAYMIEGIRDWLFEQYLN